MFFSRILGRLGLVALVGASAAVFVSSSLLAGIVGVVTVAAVLVDMFAVTRSSDSAGVAEAVGREAPERISVDLNRRT